MSGKPVIRWATREDIEAFSPMRHKPTIRAVCIDVGGEIVALGGLAFSHSRWVMFCDVREHGRRFKVSLVKAAKQMIEEARKMGIRYVYASADPREKNAAHWLRSLGFMVDPRMPNLYRWSSDG